MYAVPMRLLPNRLFDTDAQGRPRDRSYFLRAGQLRR
jgi:hypothetical protein